jgi:hypothetical protein
MVRWRFEWFNDLPRQCLFERKQESCEDELMYPPRKGEASLVKCVNKGCYGSRQVLLAVISNKSRESTTRSLYEIDARMALLLQNGSSDAETLHKNTLTDPEPEYAEATCTGTVSRYPVSIMRRTKRGAAVFGFGPDVSRSFIR